MVPATVNPAVQDDSLADVSRSQFAESVGAGPELYFAHGSKPYRIPRLKVSTPCERTPRP